MEERANLRQRVSDLWATRELSYNLADFGNFSEADAVLDTVLRPGFDKTHLPAEQLLELSQCYSHRGNLRRELGDPQGSLRGFGTAIEYARGVSSPAAAESLKGLLFYQALNFYFLKMRHEGDKALAAADTITSQPAVDISCVLLAGSVRVNTFIKAHPASRTLNLWSKVVREVDWQSHDHITNTFRNVKSLDGAWLFPLLEFTTYSKSWDAEQVEDTLFGSMNTH